MILRLLLAALLSLSLASCSSVEAERASSEDLLEGVTLIREAAAAGDEVAALAHLVEVRSLLESFRLDGSVSPEKAAAIRSDLALVERLLLDALQGEGGDAPASSTDPSASRPEEVSSPAPPLEEPSSGPPAEPSSAPASPPPSSPPAQDPLEVPLEAEVPLEVEEPLEGPPVKEPKGKGPGRGKKK